MKIYLYKVTPNKATYIGVIEQDNVPQKGYLIYFLGHNYRVVDIREPIAFVKFID